MTERIDHAAEARNAIAECSEYANQRLSYVEAAPALALLAQAHATLALVGQQRIANLIAIYVATGAAESGFIGKGFDFGFMADQIREGLAL